MKTQITARHSNGLLFLQIVCGLISTSKHFRHTDAAAIWIKDHCRKLKMPADELKYVLDAVLIFSGTAVFEINDDGELMTPALPGGKQFQIKK